MYSKNYFIWFDIQEKKFFLLSYSEVKENLRILSKPSILNRDYYSSFEAFIKEDSLQTLSIKFCGKDIYFIYKISEN